MNIIRVPNYDAMSQAAACIVASRILENPSLTLGLATGSTPIGLYNELIRLYKDGVLDFSKIHTINLDEYVGLLADHEQSYIRFMYDHLFSYVNVKDENLYIPNGMALNLQAECKRYDHIVESCKNRLQILGIGSNGHIGFNEPSNDPDTLVSFTRVVNLTSSTINDNARFFDNIGDVPKTAISMGIQSILNAREIILLASGRSKANAIRDMIYGKVIPECPASALQCHDKVTVILDEEAASKLPL